MTDEATAEEKTIINQYDFFGSVRNVAVAEGDFDSIEDAIDYLYDYYEDTENVTFVHSGTIDLVSLGEGEFAPQEEGENEPTVTFTTFSVEVEGEEDGDPFQKFVDELEEELGLDELDETEPR